MMDCTVSIALVGMGYWGKNLARNFHDLGALKLICDAAPDRLHFATEQYSDVAVCSDYSSALGDPRVTAVALATPAVSHYQMAKEALEADKDVFVEKPLSLTSAQSERVQKESVWNIVQKATPGNFPDILRTQLIKDLETSLANLKVQHAKLSALFKPGWPELDQVAGQVAEAEMQLAAEKQRAIKNADTEYRTALQREKLLTQALNAQKLEANTFNQNSIQYNILKR